MKKINLLKPFLLFSLLAVLLTLAACNNPVGNNSSNSETKKYDILLASSTYTQFKEVFNDTLDDNYFMWLKLSAAQWNTIPTRLTDSGKYMWTESQIREWLKNEGLSDAQATKQIGRLTTYEHGCIAKRNGNTVDYLIK